MNILKKKIKKLLKFEIIIFIYILPYLMIVIEYSLHIASFILNLLFAILILFKQF
jgi:hypothetical protein